MPAAAGHQLTTAHQRRLCMYPVQAAQRQYLAVVSVAAKLTNRVDVPGFYKHLSGRGAACRWTLCV